MDDTEQPPGPGTVRDDALATPCATLQEDAHTATLASDFPTVQLPRLQPSLSMTQLSGELVPGTTLRSRYVLQEVIGRGGHCIIFSATDLHREFQEDSAGNRVAIKLTHLGEHSDRRTLTLLQREFAHMQSLSHPNIVRVFDFDRDGDVWFISMELVTGRTLKDWAERSGPRADVLQMIGSCCQALGYAHSLNIVHGDLKPSNVLLTADGTVKLIDFGSVPRQGRVQDSGSAPVLAVTPQYASPQVLTGQTAEHRDDVYSVACLSYYLLSGGRHPFGGHPAFEDGRAKSTPHPLHEISTEMFAVIARGLSVERERRPATVRQFWKELNDADHRPVTQPTGVATATPGSGILIASSPVIAPPQAPRAPFDVLRGWFGSDSVRPALQAAGWMVLIMAMVGGTMLLPFGWHRKTDSAPRSIQVALTTPTVGQVTSVQPEGPSPAPAPAPAPMHQSEVISFNASEVRVSAGQSLVAIPVTRLPATRSRGAFRWRVESGSARPSIDYPPISPQVVRFHEGQSVRILFVPLLPSRETSVASGRRTFTVALQPLAGGPTLGRISRITVAIDSTSDTGRLVSYQ